MDDGGRDRIFSPARKFIARRAKRTQTLLRNCVPGSWRGRFKRSPPKIQHTRETQTSPGLEGQFSFDDPTQTSPGLKGQFSFDDSNSYHSTESSLKNSLPPIGNEPSFNEGSKSVPSHSGCSLDSGELISNSKKEYMRGADGWHSSDLKMGSCPCLHHVGCLDRSLCSLHGNTYLEKFDELQREVHMIHNTLRSLQTSPGFNSCGQFSVNIVTNTNSPPPPPPMPPSPSQSFLMPAHSPLRRHESSLVVSNGAFWQDEGKPLITLEELQKVKLRKISSFSNNLS